ncbi:MAG: restriction endonuclease subunit S [bacterium]
MTAPTKRVRHSGESRNPGSLSEGEQREALEVREGPVTPYLAKTKQLRHSREAGNPVLTFGDLTESKIDQGGPPEGDEFVYVDISSVDNKLKRIIEPKMLRVDKAPSRARQRLRVGDVLVSMTRPNLNAVAFVPASLDHSVGSTGFHVLRAREGTESKWLFHAVQSPDFVTTMSALVQGALYPAVRPKEIRAFELEVPPIDEQRRIVAELETQLTRLDASVAALKRVQANVKRYRASVLKAACEGRLVPTEAELARSDGRSAASGGDLLADILVSRRKNQKRVANEPSGAVDLPSLPEGWAWSSLGQCFTVGVGATPSRKESSYWNGDIPWVSSGEVQFGRITETHEYITATGLENSSTKLNPPGSVLLAMIGQGKTRGQAALLEIEAANNQNCAAIWVGETPIPAKYVYYWLMGRYEETRTRGSGNNQQALNKYLVEQIPLPIPPITELSRIVSEVERRLSVIEELEATVAANLKRAERLRQSVLGRAFS